MLPEFNTYKLSNLANAYEMNPVEIMCVILFWSIGNKSIAFQYTIGMQSNSKNKDVLARQFFAKDTVIKFMAEQSNNFIVNKHGEVEENESRFDVNDVKQNSNTKEENRVTVNYPDKTEISSDNIKELLEREYQKTTDPEKRTVLLIKIADFIGLKNNDQDDPLTPVIYLPERCQSCKFKQATKE